MSRVGPFRIPQADRHGFGSALRPGEPVGFRFDGRQLYGLPGDTLASALLANGYRTIGRSLKFHRPRGIFSAGPEEPNAFVQVGSGDRAVPSERAPMIEIHAGLVAASCSGWPRLRWDIGRCLDLVKPLWAAGFYNKTFLWPNWHAWEWLIRRMAGFGHAPKSRDPSRYDQGNLHCDVLIVGAGEAGLSAALVESEAGKRVVLVEMSAELGGRSAWDGSTVGGVPGPEWILAVQRKLESAPEVQILRRTTAVGHFDHGVVTLVQRLPEPRRRERYWVVRAGRVILATGAIEQPLVFCNNDRPGILLAGAAHEYLRRYAIAPGRRVVVATNNDSAYALALDLRSVGVTVHALIDSRPHAPATLAEALSAVGVPVLASSLPIDTRGFGSLAEVRVGHLAACGREVTSEQVFACDALAVSGGWNPSLALFSQAGGKIAFSEATRALEAAALHPSVALVGAAAGASASGNCGSSPVGIRISQIGSTRRQWVDLRHDVTVSDLELAVRENFGALEHVKRYTTVGMGADQGKTSNVATLEIVAQLRGLPPCDLGHTTFRPPFMPVTLGAIAAKSTGIYYAPGRRTPLHDWHAENDAVMEDFGEWKRPALYPRSGESRMQAVLREARAVRTSVGILDASSLGKIEVQGPDALALLDRFYINNLRTLQPGSARYGIMLRENGVIFDDGTVVMLGPDHFVLTTTTGNATRVAAWIDEWHQCEWRMLRATITTITDQWATISLSGPRSRDVLLTLDTNIDVAPTAFPHLGVRTGAILGSIARVYRVSFSGELTYEINVPANRAKELWDALLDAGRAYGIAPFGLEALNLLRLEKGFLHLGSDTDGTTVPDDVGWGPVALAKTSDFIGKRSLQLPESVRPDRRQLVGLASETSMRAGSHCRFAGSHEPSDGWVTSAGISILGGRPIALAMLQGGRRRLGAEVGVHDNGRLARARVVEPIFFDPSRSRMHA